MTIDGIRQTGRSRVRERDAWPGLASGDPSGGRDQRSRGRAAVRHQGLAVGRAAQSEADMEHARADARSVAQLEGTNQT